MLRRLAFLTLTLFIVSTLGATTITAPITKPRLHLEACDFSHPPPNEYYCADCVVPPDAPQPGDPHDRWLSDCFNCADQVRFLYGYDAWVWQRSGCLEIRTLSSR